MVNLFRAEWQKTSGNRWAVGFLIWIFPAAALGMSLAAIFISLLSADYRTYLQEMGMIGWNTRMLETVNFLNSEIGRLIILAFTAIMFAGEYQYGTWKNLVPRRARVPLLLNKFFTLGVFVTVSVIAFSVIAVIGTIVTSALAGVEIGPAPTAEVVGQFARDYALQLGVTLCATFVACGYAAAAAIVTRSILGSLLVGFLLSLGETVVLLLAALLHFVLKFPAQIVSIYQITPGYNLANINAWVKNGEGFSQQFTADYALTPFSIEVSMLIVALWIVGMVALALFLFRRQDITS